MVNWRFLGALLGATFLMGSSFVAGKILLQQGVPPMSLVAWRFLVAAVATLPLVRAWSPSFRSALAPREMTWRHWCTVALIGALQTAAVMGLLFLAMQHISASVAAILLFTNPILVAILGWLILSEPLGRLRLAGLGMGAVGVALAIGVGPELFRGGATLVGEAIGLLSAFCWACATIVAKRSQWPMSTWALSFWQMLIGSMILLVISYATDQHWPAHTTWSQWGWFIWLAIPASTGSFGLWFVALSQGGATKASSYLFLTPVFTVILSFFVLGTALTWLQASGGLLIGMGLWAVNRVTPAENLNEAKKEALYEGEP